MELYQEALKAMNELCERANLKKGQIVVVGCSTSEIMGKRIGSSGTLEVAQEVLRGLMEPVLARGGVLAVQCCEHLNRSLVIPRQALEDMKYEIAGELGINLKQGYNGDLPSRQAGSIGGYMVKRLIEQAERQMANK